MKKQEEASFSPIRLQRSFKYALQGLALLGKEKNIRVQRIVAALTLLAAFLFHLSVERLAMVLLCIVAVMGAEGLNTAIEKLCDKASPAFSEEIKQVKDIAAAAVLIVSLGAVGVGVLLFFF